MSATTPRAIAFIHIPKTAGTSVVKAFERELGVGACFRKFSALTEQDFEAYRFISGHHTLSSITPVAWRFTFLREPVAQLASHLRWLDYYNQPPFQEQLHTLSPEMRQIVVRVGQTDFGSASDINALFDWLPDNAPAVLSNIHSIVLSRRPGQKLFTDPRDLAAAAIFNLRDLKFVGITEEIEPDMARLFRRLGLTGTPLLRHDNAVSSSRRFDLADAAIRGALERQMQADIRLYEHVLKRRRQVVIKW